MWVEGFILLMSSTLVDPKPRFPSVSGVTTFSTPCPDPRWKFQEIRLS